MAVLWEEDGPVSDFVPFLTHGGKRFRADHLIEDESSCKYVRRGAGDILKQFPSQENPVAFGPTPLLGGCCQPEVANLDAAFRNKNIGWFQVQMQQAVRMHGLNASQDIFHVLTCPEGTDWTLMSIQNRLEGPTGAVLHLSPQNGICLPRTVILNDIVTIRESSDAADLLQEKLPVLEPPKLAFRPFQSVKLRTGLVACSPNVGKSTLPQDTQELELVLLLE
mmetsp:Transcript_1217/g.2697  ORF Transcript_1217/g.2697 Transcript_1217/m.2697 type:complete len:222 (-) Transcript_1217:405-1070(-)